MSICNLYVQLLKGRKTSLKTHNSIKKKRYLFLSYVMNCYLKSIYAQNQRIYKVENYLQRSCFQFKVILWHRCLYGKYFSRIEAQYICDFLYHWEFFQMLHFINTKSVAGDVSNTCFLYSTCNFCVYNFIFFIQNIALLKIAKQSAFI